MVAKRKQSHENERVVDSRGLSPKQQAIFASARRLLRETGGPTELAQLATANPDLTKSSLRYNLKALVDRGYLKLTQENGTTQLWLGDRAKREADLWRLIDEGLAHWSGGKPMGSRHPIKLRSGPSVSDYIIEERERLR